MPHYVSKVLMSKSRLSLAVMVLSTLVLMYVSSDHWSSKRWYTDLNTSGEDVASLGRTLVSNSSYHNDISVIRTIPVMVGFANENPVFQNHVNASSPTDNERKKDIQSVQDKERQSKVGHTTTNTPRVSNTNETGYHSNHVLSLLARSTSARRIYHSGTLRNKEIPIVTGSSKDEPVVQKQTNESNSHGNDGKNEEAKESFKVKGRDFLQKVPAIPFSSDATKDVDIVSSHHDNIASLDPRGAPDCYPKGLSTEYRGVTNVTASGTPCIPWNDVVDEGLTADEFPDGVIPYDACRDVTDLDYTEDTPWCYTNVEGLSEECGVLECDD